MEKQHYIPEQLAAWAAEDKKREDFENKLHVKTTWPNRAERRKVWKSNSKKRVKR